MLIKDWNVYFLYLAITLFEIVSFFLFTKVITDAINPIQLIIVYVVPLALIKWFQLSERMLSPNVYLIVPIIQALLFSLFGYSLFMLASLLLFSYWRIYVFMKETYPEKQGTWLGFVLATTFSVLFSKREFLLEHVSWFLFLLLLFLSIRVLLQLKDNAWILIKGSYRQLFIYLLGAALGLLLVFQSGLYLLQQMLPFLGRVIGFIVGYPVSWLVEKLNITTNQGQGTESQAAEPLENPFKDIQDGAEGSIDNVLTTIIAISIIALVIFLFYLARKNVKNIELEQEQLIQVGEDEKRISLFQSLKNLRVNQYSDHGRSEVRLQFYKLQLFLKKRGLERKDAETVDEWFKRLKLENKSADDVLRIYKQSRYSHHSLTANDLKIYGDGIKEIKNLFKQSPPKKG